MPGRCETSACSASARAAMRASCTFMGSTPGAAIGPCDTHWDVSTFASTHHLTPRAPHPGRLQATCGHERLRCHAGVLHLHRLCSRSRHVAPSPILQDTRARQGMCFPCSILHFWKLRPGRLHGSCAPFSTTHVIGSIGAAVQASRPFIGFRRSYWPLRSLFQHLIGHTFCLWSSNYSPSYALMFAAVLCDSPISDPLQGGTKSNLQRWTLCLLLLHIFQRIVQLAMLQGCNLHESTHSGGDFKGAEA